MGLELNNTKKLAINKREMTKREATQTPSTLPAEQPRVFAVKRPSPQQPDCKDPDKVSLTSMCK